MNRNFTHTLLPGEKLQNGKYIIIEVFGQGYFSITYLATQSFLHKRVIVHEYFLREHCSRNEGSNVTTDKLDKAIFDKLGNRWFEEAQTLARLSPAEHIASVLDTFQENNTMYFVTEFITEETLQTYTLNSKEHRLTEAQALEFIFQLGKGLSLLHANSILHLALGPRNIIIGKDRNLVIVNFGIASGEIPSEIMPGSILLTKPGYSAPELYRPEGKTGVISDIYSFGAILYFLLTGKDPVSSAERQQKALTEPKQIQPLISDRTNRAVLKAMSMNPEERFQNVQEFLKALPSVNAGKNISKRKIVLVSSLVMCAIVCSILLAFFIKQEVRNNEENPDVALNNEKDTEHFVNRSKISVKHEALRGMTLISDPAANNSVKLGKFYALIIGIQNYQKFEKLNEPINDAQKFYDILIQEYTFNKENTIFLKDSPRDSIYSALQFFRNNLSTDDNLLIFYSGHGIYDKEEDVGYILPVDAELANSSKWISFKELRTKFKVIPARHILLIADACYAGSVLKGGENQPGISPKEEMTLDLVKSRSRKAFTSAYLKQVPDRSDFAKYMLLCLINNKEKVLLSEDLYFLTKNSIKHSTSNQMPPKFGTLLDCDDEGGDFVFIRRNN